MSLRALASDWSVDGALGIAFLALVAALGCGYALAAIRGTRRDRRHRRWPARRTLSFLAGLIVLVVDLDSGIGTLADTRLSVHMLEHMVMWVLVAPLIAGGAPVRLAFFTLARDHRQTLARWLRSRPVRLLTSPAGSVSVFAGVLLVTHIPAVYSVALTNEYAHEAEHALYLLAAVLMWATLLGVDPLPHRVSARARVLCLVACMLPMAAIAIWLAIVPDAVYGHYVAALGGRALNDQRLAATIMWAGGLPAFAIPALLRIRIPGVAARAAAGAPGAEPLAHILN